MLAVLVANHPMKTIRPQESEETKSVSLPLIHIISRQIRAFQTCKSVGLWDFIVPEVKTELSSTKHREHQNNHGLSHGFAPTSKKHVITWRRNFKNLFQLQLRSQPRTALVQRSFGRKKQQNGSIDVWWLYISSPNSIFLIYHIPIMFCLGETIPPFFLLERFVRRAKNTLRVAITARSFAKQRIFHPLKKPNAKQSSREIDKFDVNFK